MKKEAKEKAIKINKLLMGIQRDGFNEGLEIGTTNMFVIMEDIFFGSNSSYSYVYEEFWKVKEAWARNKEAILNESDGE